MGQDHVDSNPITPLLRQLHGDVSIQTWAWPFHEPVEAEAVPGYYDVIKNPMGSHDSPPHRSSLDLKTMDFRINSDSYQTLSMFVADFDQMIDNCRKFNLPKSTYVKCANKLDQFFKDRLETVENHHTVE